jgi:predicted amidohydrolase
MSTIGADLGDLYAHLYDECAGQQMPHPGTFSRLASSGVVRRIADDVVAEVETTGELADEWRTSTDFRHRFAVLDGVRRLLRRAYAGHGAGAVPSTLYNLTTHVRTTGRFNRDESLGAVLPRFVQPARPQAEAVELSDVMTGVLRVPPAAWDVAKTGFRPIDRALDFDAPGWADELCVASAPVLGGFDDADVELVLAHSSFYRVNLGPAVKPRLSGILAALDNSGAQLAVLPELCLNDALLLAWQRLMRATDPPPGCKLEWVFVGTGPVVVGDDKAWPLRPLADLGGPPDEVAPPNRGVLLHRASGEILAAQDKQHPFTLTATQVPRWHLTKLGAGPVDEWLTAGDGLVVIDSRRGRFAIAICEDITRPDVRQTILDLGVSHVLVPVFSDPMVYDPPSHRFSWSINQQVGVLTESGAGSVVANSLAVPDEHGARGPRPTLAVLLSRPAGDDYPARTEVEMASLVNDPLEVVVMSWGFPPT